MNEEGLIAKAMENLMCCPPWEEEARGGGGTDLRETRSEIFFVGAAASNATREKR
jgi:hypothetical protein